MAKEKSIGKIKGDEVYSGDAEGTPVNAPKRSAEGTGNGSVTRLASENGGQYRSGITDNPGNQPYSDGADAGDGNTNQDARGDANLYDEKSNGSNAEHLESAADKDVDAYYGELSKRRNPNYDRNPQLQVKQAPLDLAPVDGGDGFVGSDTGPAVGFNYITGKKGFSEDLPVWLEKSSFTNYPDNSGSTGNVFPNPGEQSRDEFADWKYVQTDEGIPQTHRKTFGAGDAGSNPDEGEAIMGRPDGGGEPNVQDIPGPESGNRDFGSDLPQTDYTHNYGGGAPMFKAQGPDTAEAQYKPKPRD